MHVGEGGAGLVTWCLVVAVDTAVGTGAMRPAVHTRTRWGPAASTTTTTTTSIGARGWLVVGTWSSRYSGSVGRHDGDKLLELLLEGG